jgi:hypothetical protein
MQELRAQPGQRRFGRRNHRGGDCGHHGVLDAGQDRSVRIPKAQKR